MQADLTAETALLKEQGIVPGLVVLLVGEDKSKSNVCAKQRTGCGKNRHTI